MNRRDSLKAIGLTAISTGVILEACKSGKETEETAVEPEVKAQPGRQDFEIERDKLLNAEKFFNTDEMATIAVLADIIIPKDEKSGSASDAGVPDFIAFIVKDMPDYQVPMRGGLKWLDMQCFKRYQKTFKDASPAQQILMVEDIAYPDKVKPGLQQGVAFFSLMRDLTSSGFFTSEMGIKDIGYLGNQPNRWEGVPADVLKHYSMHNI